MAALSIDDILYGGSGADSVGAPLDLGSFRGSGGDAIGGSFGNLGKDLGVLGSAVQAFGSIFSGESKARDLETQSQIYGINADMAHFSADLFRRQADIAAEGANLAYAKGALAESRLRKQGDDVAAAQALEIAGRHLDPASSSPLVLAAKSASQLQADIDLTRAGSALEGAEAIARSAELQYRAYAATGQEVTARVNQRSAEARASSARIAGYVGAGTALLSGASRFLGGR